MAALARRSRDLVAPEAAWICGALAALKLEHFARLRVRPAQPSGAMTRSDDKKSEPMNRRAFLTKTLLSAGAGAAAAATRAAVALPATAPREKIGPNQPVGKACSGR
jgi:hypothetical protein